ncbi:hypothetical protein V3O24_16900 [Methylobacter sp. Wu8]|nr:hypothetical protein [Methylobacter tundripaludum]MCK9636880.1 hypothetical protein [Methylobacter tundripaludum]
MELHIFNRFNKLCRLTQQVRQIIDAVGSRKTEYRFYPDTAAGSAVK